MPQDDADSLLIGISRCETDIVLVGGEFGLFQILRRLVIRRDRLEILRPALALQMRHHLLDLLVGAERPVHARDPPAAGHVQHVALP